MVCSTLALLANEVAYLRNPQSPIGLALEIKQLVLFLRSHPFIALLKIQAKKTVINLKSKQY